MMGEVHEVRIHNRQLLSLSGMLHVESFDEAEIVVETNMGTLSLKGEGLHVKELNLEEGKLTVEGFVTHIDYLDERAHKDMKDKAKGFWQRLMK